MTPSATEVSPFKCSSPFELFACWLEEAETHTAISEPTAMTLATCVDNQPSSRVVLLKEHDARGFVFFTNYQSRKSRDLERNPLAALSFYWMPLARQVRIEGRLEKVEAEESDAYFASRGREKQLGAWASEQSSPMPSPDALTQRIETYAAQFPEGTEVPRPPHWGGWRLVPERMEFWIQRDHRLHERILFTRSGQGWDSGTLLFP